MLIIEVILFWPSCTSFWRLFKGSYNDDHFDSTCKPAASDNESAFTWSKTSQVYNKKCKKTKFHPKFGSIIIYPQWSESNINTFEFKSFNIPKHFSAHQLCVNRLSTLFMFATTLQLYLTDNLVKMLNFIRCPAFRSRFSFNKVKSKIFLP